LTSSDPYQVIAGLEMIRILKLNDFLNQVGNLLLKTQNFKIKTYCLNTLATLPLSLSNLTYLEEVLQTESDAKVLVLIIKNIAQFTSANINNIIEKRLTHPAPIVFVEACLCLHRHPKYKRKRWLEQQVLVRLHQAQLPDEKITYLYALGELRQTHFSDTVLNFLNSPEAETHVAAFKAFISIHEGQPLTPHQSRLFEALNSPDNTMKIMALQALKDCQSLNNWQPIIRLLAAKDPILVEESKELLRLNLGLCKSILFNHILSESISVQQRFEILSLIYPALNYKQHQCLQQGANEALKKFIEINALLKIHTSLGERGKIYDLIEKILQEMTQAHLHHVLTIITFASQKNRVFFQKVSHALSLNETHQGNTKKKPSQAKEKYLKGNASEVLSHVSEKYLTRRVYKYFDERLDDIKALNRIYITLFGEPLKIDENHYETQLRELNNDMIEACLLYLEQEKTGKFYLENVNKNVRYLLT